MPPTQPEVKGTFSSTFVASSHFTNPFVDRFWMGPLIKNKRSVLRPQRMGPSERPSENTLAYQNIKKRCLQSVISFNHLYQASTQMLETRECSADTTRTPSGAP